MSSKRAAIRIRRGDEARSVSSTEVVLTGDSEPISVETGDSDSITVEPVNVSLEEPSQVVSSHITLLNYRRAANTASHCLFPQCTY